MRNLFLRKNIIVFPVSITEKTAIESLTWIIPIISIIAICCMLFDSNFVKF